MFTNADLAAFKTPEEYATYQADLRGRMQPDRQDPLAGSRLVPALPEEFSLGELGHGYP